MRRLAPFALCILAACSDLFSPNRTDTYQFRCVPGLGSICTETQAFHWPRELMPVRVYVAGGSALAPHVTTGLARWNGAFLYGELHAVAVSDSSTADIIVENIFPPDGNFLREPFHAFAVGCTGATEPPINDSYPLPIHAYIWSNTGTQVPGLDLCYSIVVTHELGHAFGILNHSPNVGDVMYASPVLDGLSDRDRQTIETAYHTPATVTISGRR
jgi:hypothetical protein